MKRRALAALVGLALSAPAFAQSSAKARLDAAKADLGNKVAAVDERTDMSGVVVVSDREFNTFVFNGPVRKVMFPSGSPVSGEPVYLPGNETVVIEFGKSERPVQMLVVMDDGSSRSLRVLPRPVKGAEHRIDGGRARRVVPREGGAPAVDTRASDMALLKRIVMADVPADFETVELPKPVLFDKFRVVAMRGWSDGARKRVMVFALVANPGQTAAVAPPQFYRPGITAVMVDGDVVDERTSPLLYVVEELGDE